MPTRPPVRAQDVAMTWSKTRRGKKTQLRDYRQLGAAYDRFIAYAPHGQKRPRTDQVTKAIGRQEPGLSASYIRGVLYKARRFTWACRDQRDLLPRLQAASLTWRQVTELLSMIRPEQLEASPVVVRVRETGIKELNRLLKQVTRQRRPLTSAQMVAEMKTWSRAHPGYLGKSKAAWQGRTAARKLTRQLSGALSDWKPLRRSVSPEDWRALNRRFTAGQKDAVAALRELEQNLESRH